MALALRAVPVAATIVTDMGMAAIGIVATVDMASQCTCAAHRQSIQAACLPAVGRQISYPVAVLSEYLGHLIERPHQLMYSRVYNLSKGLNDLLRPKRATCRYISVDLMSSCPMTSFNVMMSMPISNRCVA